MQLNSIYVNDYRIQYFSVGVFLPVVDFKCKAWYMLCDLQFSDICKV